MTARGSGGFWEFVEFWKDLLFAFMADQKMMDAQAERSGDAVNPVEARLMESPILKIPPDILACGTDSLGQLLVGPTFIFHR
jgi:hypothetical protein